MLNRETLLRLLLNQSVKKNKATRTKKLNRNKRWIFENTNGYLFVYNSNNRKRTVRSSNIAYRNNGRRIISIRPEYEYVPVKSGGYRVPPRRRRV